jgi:hypothetical protein
MPINSPKVDPFAGLDFITVFSPPPPRTRIELDLKNPIFVLYVDVTGSSRQTANELICNAKSMFDIYSNVTMWIFPHNAKTKVECVYDGGSRVRNLELNDLIKVINSRVDILSQSKNFEDFKINIRDWRIDSLIKDNGTEEK